MSKPSTDMVVTCSHLVTEIAQIRHDLNAQVLALSIPLETQLLYQTHAAVNEAERLLLLARANLQRLQEILASAPQP